MRREKGRQSPAFFIAGLLLEPAHALAASRRDDRGRQRRTNQIR
jgi:hypothetical protein